MSTQQKILNGGVAGSVIESYRNTFAGRVITLHTPSAIVMIGRDGSVAVSGTDQSGAPNSEFYGSVAAFATAYGLGDE